MNCDRVVTLIVHMKNHIQMLIAPGSLTVQLVMKMLTLILICFHFTSDRLLARLATVWGRGIVGAAVVMLY
jgi:hypothetical protein